MGPSCRMHMHKVSGLVKEKISGVWLGLGKDTPGFQVGLISA